MVSTRTKYKFSEGERVLCYEPDQTKAKVLYDSKVLEVKVGKDDKGRKSVDYLIHFQGWNSSYDRCVSEDHVLKDTEENRKLQQDLAAKAELQPGAYFYRKEHKKKKNLTLSERTFEGGYSCSSQEGESIEEHDFNISTDDDKESSVGTDDSLEQTVPLELGPCIRALLENDYDLVKHQNKLITLPASPTVIQILGGYLRFFTSRICRRDEEESTRQGKRRTSLPRPTDRAQELEWICANVNLCKEVIDGIRISFDYYLLSLLLYSQEDGQYEIASSNVQTVAPEPKPDSATEEENVKCDEPLASSRSPAQFLGGSADVNETDRRRSLRSHKDAPSSENPPNTIPTNGVAKLTARNLAVASALAINHGSALSTSSTSSYYGPLAGHAAHLAGNTLSPELTKLISLTNQWKLVPDSYYTQSPPPPSTIYGAVHLARLFVKLPSILYAANLPLSDDQPRFLQESKMKVLLHHLSLFLMYLESKTEWFNEEQYYQNPVKVEPF